MRIAHMHCKVDTHIDRARGISRLIGRDKCGSAWIAGTGTTIGRAPSKNHVFATRSLLRRCPNFEPATFYTFHEPRSLISATIARRFTITWAWAILRPIVALWACEPDSLCGGCSSGYRKGGFVNAWVTEQRTHFWNVSVLVMVKT